MSHTSNRRCETGFLVWLVDLMHMLGGMFGWSDLMSSYIFPELSSDFIKEMGTKMKEAVFDIYPQM